MKGYRCAALVVGIGDRNESMNEEKKRSGERYGKGFENADVEVFWVFLSYGF